jgi:hypothetical protein
MIEDNHEAELTLEQAQLLVMQEDRERLIKEVNSARRLWAMQIDRHLKETGCVDLDEVVRKIKLYDELREVALAVMNPRINRETLVMKANNALYEVACGTGPVDTAV